MTPAMSKKRNGIYELAEANCNTALKENDSCEQAKEGTSGCRQRC